MSGRVFMPQRPVFRTRHGWDDKYDLSPAERFGELVSVIPVGQGVRDPGRLMRLMEEGLADFDEGDFMLAVGDPFAIAVAVMVAASRTGGRVHLLKWDRIEGEYADCLATTG